MTDWQDRNLTKSVSTGQGSSGDTDIIFLRGVNQKHSGVEIETNYMVNDMLDLMFVHHLVIGNLTETLRELIKKMSIIQKVK